MAGAAARFADGLHCCWLPSSRHALYFPVAYERAFTSNFLDMCKKYSRHFTLLGPMEHCTLVESLQFCTIVRCIALYSSGHLQLTLQRPDRTLRWSGCTTCMGRTLSGSMLGIASKESVSGCVYLPTLPSTGRGCHVLVDPHMHAKAAHFLFAC